MNDPAPESPARAAPAAPPRPGAALWLAFFAALFLAYLPALRAGFIWDDDHYVTENLTLRSLGGLGRIWFELGATPQYYPLVHTTFWIEYRLWGLAPLGYHAVNVALHGLNAFLVWRVLARLGVRGAFFAAALFAFHPVCVESVAWVTERKNVLSGAFYLAALDCFIRFFGAGAGGGAPARKDWKLYAAGSALFAGALMSKTVTATLPAAALLIIWMQRGRVAPREAALLAPHLILGAAAGLVTAWIEEHSLGGLGAGASGAEWDYSFIERMLIAGRAIGFYLVKLLAPANLAFIYPRWEIDAGDGAAYLYPVAVALLLFALWQRRGEIGRGPLAAALFFLGTLFPALGFLNVYPMRYSFVADHFQYLAMLGPIALVAAAAASAAERIPARTRAAVLLAPVILFALQSFAQCSVYRDVETLWRDTLAKNPRAWIAHNNLAALLIAEGRLAEAEEHLAAVLAAKPQYPEAHFNMGLWRERSGDPARAAECYRRAVALAPDWASAHNNLSVALAAQGRSAEALASAERAAELDPGNAAAHFNRASALFALGRAEAAAEAYRAALAVEPRLSAAENGLGAALASLGRGAEARAHFERALALDPANAVARANLEALGAGAQPAP